MSLLFKEYCRFVPVADTTAAIPLKEEALNDLSEPVPGTLMVELEGIHAYPFHTRNYTRYMPEALKDSIPRWTNPYLKPLIKYHNDQDGKIIGRVYHTEYADHTSVEGAGGLLFTIAVPDQEAARDVQNRLLETVSIGVSANDVRCSVCGAHITDAAEGCPEGHKRGSMYDGQYCFWDIYAIDPKEISYVIVPSDPYAKNLRLYKIGEQDIQLAAADDGIQGVSLQEQTGGKNPTEMEKQLEEAKARIAELEAKLKEAEKPSEELTALKEENEKLKASVTEIQAALDKNKEAVTTAESAKAEADAALETAKAETEVLRKEKEEAEATGIQTQENFRAFITRILNDYRKIVGKAELKEEELKNRSMESLNDSIADLREEIGALKTVDIQEGKVPNPTLPPQDDKPSKTEHEYRDVKLAEGLEKLFRKLV